MERNKRNERSGSAEPRSEQLVQWLLAYDGVQELTANAGDVLVYNGHLANGLLVVVEGTVQFVEPDPASPHDSRAEGRADSRAERVVSEADASAQPIMLPAAAELDLSSSWVVRAATRAKIIFVARSVLITHPGLCSDIAAATREVSLCGDSRGRPNSAFC